MGEVEIRSNCPHLSDGGTREGTKAGTAPKIQETPQIAEVGEPVWRRSRVWLRPRMHACVRTSMQLRDHGLYFYWVYLGVHLALLLHVLHITTST